jgi:hypothetical protein
VLVTFVDGAGVMQQADCPAVHRSEIRTLSCQHDSPRLEDESADPDIGS